MQAIVKFSDYQCIDDFFILWIRRSIHEASEAPLLNLRFFHRHLMHRLYRHREK